MNMFIYRSLVETVLNKVISICGTQVAGGSEWWPTNLALKTFIAQNLWKSFLF